MGWGWEGRCQTSWIILPLEIVGTSLVWIAARDHVAVQGLCRTVPYPHWQQCSGELTLPLKGCSTQESAPASPLSNTVELTVVVRARVGELPQGMSMGELDPPLLVIPSSF